MGGGDQNDRDVFDVTCFTCSQCGIDATEIHIEGHAGCAKVYRCKKKKA